MKLLLKRCEKGKIMDRYTATEQAYKNGYTKGYEDGKPKWIPVTERLPKPFVTVLTCFLGGVYFGYRQPNVDWEGVTHWMPLPEPPEEDE